MPGKKRVQVVAPPSGQAAEPVVPEWWIRCRKCGERPPATPNMACAKCKTAHGEWTPNPVEHLNQYRSQILQMTTNLTSAKKEIANIDSGKFASMDRVRVLKAQLASFDERIQQIELERDAIEVEAMSKGPETKVRQQTLVKNTNRRVTELTLKVVAAQEALEAAEEELRAVETKEQDLEKREAELSRQKVSLMADNLKMREALRNVDRGAGSGAGVLTPDILALVGRGAAAMEADRRRPYGY